LLNKRKIRTVEKNTYLGFVAWCRKPLQKNTWPQKVRRLGESFLTFFLNLNIEIGK